MTGETSLTTPCRLPEKALTGLREWTPPILVELEWNENWRRFYCDVVGETAEKGAGGKPP
jgi:hypothetical protein